MHISSPELMFSLPIFNYGAQMRNCEKWRDVLQLSQFSKGVQNLLPQLQTIAEILPPPTLQWKLKLLEEGSR